MKKLIFGALSPALVAGLAYAQAPNRAAIEKTLIERENAINTAFATNDVAGFKKYLAPDAYGIDPGGLNSVAEFEKQMSQVKVESWKIDNTKVIWVNDDTAVLTYTWTGKGTMMGQPFPSPTYASTIYTNRNGNWVAVFHQETAAAPPMKK